MSCEEEFDDITIFADSVKYSKMNGYKSGNLEKN
jgi:hypothetical protein